MLRIREEELTILKAENARKCTCERPATWIGKKLASEEKRPFCAWCLLYSGESQWGSDNRQDIQDIGPAAVMMASASSRAGTHVPVLDELHRLPSEDAEKLMLGVAFTSFQLRSLGR